MAIPLLGSTPQSRGLDYLQNMQNVGPGYVPSGAPTPPQFQSLLDRETGLMPSQYLRTNQLNTQGLEAIRGRALSTGPSAWAQMRGQELATEETQGMNRLAAQAQGANAAARASLARRRGLSTGAAERLAQGGQRNTLLARQGATLAGQQARQGLATEDERMRSNMLMQLPGMESQAEGVRQNVEASNIGAALGEVNAKRAADQAAYQAQMQAWAAEQQAKAIRAAQSPSMLSQLGGLGKAIMPGLPGGFGF